jgi:hypothetical protein
LRRQIFKKCVCDVLLNFVFLAVVQLIGDKNGNPLPPEEDKGVVKEWTFVARQVGKINIQFTLVNYFFLLKFSFFSLMLLVFIRGRRGWVMTIMMMVQEDCPGDTGKPGGG